MEEFKNETVRNQVMKMQAVRQAMCEIIEEQRQEILRRARAKLTAMGITVEVSDGDVATGQSL